MRGPRSRLRALLLVALAAGSAAAAACAPSSTAARPPAARTISFSGHTWAVKSSAGRIGPGPNYFSSSADNVWVDGSGRLHLKITNAGGRWYCAEIVNTRSLGRGTYTFVLDSPVGSLDPNVTLGLFTWSDRPKYAHREIDIEFARWGNAADATNGQYVVQPWDAPSHLRRLTQPAASAPSTHSFTWGTSSVEFASSTASPSSWTYSGSDVPQPGDERARMNLWLFQGSPPTDGQPVEVVVDSFSFAPEA